MVQVSRRDNPVLDLQLTESITRFLRNKDSDVDSIYEFTTDKLFKEGVYLPQKEKFMLDLLVDRITQSNKLSEKFRFDFKTWKLLNLVCYKCEEDPSLRMIRFRVLSGVKFGDVFTKLFEEVYQKQLHKDVEYLKEIITTLDHVLRNYKVHFSDDQNLAILKYLGLFVVENQGQPAELAQMMLVLIPMVFSLNNSNLQKFDSKHKSEFVRCCLANTLISIESYASTEKLKTELRNVISKIIFDEVEPKTTLKYIEQFVSVDENSKLNSSEVLYLLKMIIQKLEVAELEEVVKVFVGFFPHYSAVLLKEVTDMNKTLSSEFLSSLVEKALQNTNDSSFELIIHSIKRSADVTLKSSEDICKFCKSGDKQSVLLLKELFDSYVRAREVELFIRLWSKMDSAYPDSVFQSDEFIDYTSLKLVTLSYAQLSRVLESEIEIYKSNPNSTPVFLLAVCNGLWKGVSGSIQNALSKTLINNLYQLQPLLLSLLKINGPYKWKLSFHVLSLFDFENVEDEIVGVLKQKYENSDYYYFTMLRLVEQNIDFSNSKFLKHFKSYFNKKSDTEFKHRVFSRWFVLIEVLFSKDDISSFVHTIMESLINIEDILQNHLLQEQSKITGEFIQYFIKHAKHRHYLQLISVYALNRKQKEDILNLLIEDVPHDYVKPVMSHILEMPSFKSKIETNFNSLLELSSDLNFHDIVKTILKMHLNQPIESKKFLDDAFQTLTDSISALTTKNFDQKSKFLQTSLLLIQQAQNSKLVDRREQLVTASVEKFVEILCQPESLSADQTCLLLDFLSEINFENAVIPVTKCDIKQVVFSLAETFRNERLVQRSLFKYVCSLDGVFKSEYVMALYVILEEADNSSVCQNIAKLAQREDVFIKTWFNICESIESCSDKDFEKYIDICVAFIDNVPKTNEDSNIKLYKQLFVLTISSIYTKVSNESVHLPGNFIKLLNCLKTVTSRKIWIFTQYSMELIIALVSNVSEAIQTADGDSELLKDNYINLTQTISSIILYQRKRLSNRHHLICAVFTSLMKTLFKHSENLGEESGLSFERLVSNLCEPNIHNITVKYTETMENREATAQNTLAETKASLRKYITVLVFNYIKFYLQFPVDTKVKKYMESSVYMMMDLLTLNELNYINKSLDNQSRVVFKTTYDDYNKYYKWSEE